MQQASIAIEAEMAGGRFPFRDEYEDIHMNVEVRLARADRRRVPAGCTPPARATTRWRPISGSGCATPPTAAEAGAEGAAAGPAGQGRGRTRTSLMPGFTHLQPAQPVTFGHHLMAYVEMFGRDASRFR